MRARSYGLTLMVVVLLALGVVVTAHTAQGQEQAQPSPETKMDPADAQRARALLLEMNQLQEQLTQIQQDTLAAEPKLQEKASSYEALLVDSMRGAGHDPVKSLNHIESLEQRIQEGHLPPQEREGLVQELQEEQQQLAMAEQAALQDPVIQAARDEFLQAMLTAMQAHDPDTEHLLGQLAQKNDELHSIVTAQADPVE